MTDLEILNKREPKPVLMARLMTEACGKQHKVSLADVLAFAECTPGTLKVTTPDGRVVWSLQ